MAMLPFRSDCRGARGFTLIETMFAITIFAVGLLSLAALMSTMNVRTGQARLMGTATMLASEKLEDLNRYPKDSTAAPVTPGGSLGSDMGNYYDEVQISAANGGVTEVTYNPSSACSEVFIHSSNGTASDTPCVAHPTALPGSSTFHRRWLVENPVTVAGSSLTVRRVTVWVSLWSALGSTQAANFQGQPITFQMSTVRP